MIEIQTLQLTAPDACIVGVIEEGLKSDWAGDPIPQTPCNAVLLHPLSQADAVTRAQTISRFVELRRAGATLLLISHDEPLLEQCADEIWWLRDKQLVARGDPAEILPLYRRHVATVSARGAARASLPRWRPRYGTAMAGLNSTALNCWGRTANPPPFGAVVSRLRFG